MDSVKKDEEAIFYAALAMKSREERSAYLSEACGDDQPLLARVESLLKANGVDDNFLEPPFLASDDLRESTSQTEVPGTVIGRYKLLEKIGEGGMATVYMAEQEQPIRRQVALKIIKLGMDTKQVIARFEVERQALALMDHPNIAKVHDAGTTETGRPYFVMELVKGLPITKYCDENNLTTRERLDLFIQVCQAVQHAHQKGIIHRDIKPTNVLVTLHDGRPVPKIIDFGIAKATKQKLTEKTLFTQYAQLIGTPEYMSPEQAEWSGLDVDTRTDIYSLGVLLYELLTGTTPFDAKALREASYSKMQKIICEEEPTKPSTKLSGLGETLAEVAKHRKTSPDLLRKLIRGDLDWIVMKCLEKNRTRRYATAGELAADIERNLNHKPVQAAAPSIPYKVRKFVRRHYVSVVAGSVVTAALIIGGLLATIGFIQANTQRKRAETNLEQSELNFQSAQKAVETITKIAQNLSNIPEMHYVRQSILEEALQFYEGFVQEKSTDPQVRFNTAKTYYRIGEVQRSLGSLEEAKQAHQKVVSLLNDLPEDLSWESEIEALRARGLWALGMIAYETRNYEEALNYLKQAKITNTSAMFKSNCDAILQKIKLEAAGEKPAISPKDTIIDPNELGLIVWRMGNLSRTRHVNNQNHITWSSSLRVQSPKAIEPPLGAKTVVVPNCLADTEGDLDFWTVGPSKYDMKFQVVFPRDQFSDLTGSMHLTRWAGRPDIKQGGRQTFAFLNYHLRLSTTETSPIQLKDVFTQNEGEDITTVYNNLLFLYFECLPGIGPKEFIPFGLEKPFLYDPAKKGDLLGDVRAKGGLCTGSMDKHSLSGENVIVADYDSPVAKWRGSVNKVIQFTFVPEESLAHDPVVALEVTSDALMIPGPVEDMQLLVRALKQSCLGEVITQKAKYTSQFSNVVKVSSSGLITPLAPGVTTIQINYTDPVSNKAFAESAIVEVTRFSDVISSDPVNKDERYNKGGDI